MRIDLHTHSNVSDGTDTPAELVAKATASGLDVIALCDHDTMAGIPEAIEAGHRDGVTIQPGLEMSTRYQGTPVHLLGYGCQPNNPALAAELTKLRSAREDRLPQMLALLDEYGMPLTDQEVAAQRGDAPSLGRPHVADAMVAKGYVASRDEAFRGWLDNGGKAYVDRYATDLPTAIGLIQAAGGVAVVAHPWSRQSKGVLSVDALRVLASDGLDGVEVHHTDHDDAAQGSLAAIGTQLGLLLTGSSDYHGTGKTKNPLGRFTTTPPVYHEIERRILDRGGLAAS